MPGMLDYAHVAVCERSTSRLHKAEDEVEEGGGGREEGAWSESFLKPTIIATPQLQNTAVFVDKDGALRTRRNGVDSDTVSKRSVDARLFGL
jgi:hypothetical protein